MNRSLLLFLVPLVGVGCKAKDEPTPKPVVNVAVQRAALSNLPLLVSAPAEVHGKSEAHIASRITAPVKTLLVHEGQPVRQGQLLAVLDQRDLVAQRAAAVAAVSNAEASLQKTETAELPQQLTSVQSEYAARKAELDLAKAVYEKRKGLLAQGAISERELQTSAANLAQAQANFQSASTSLNVTRGHASADTLRMAQSSLAESKANAALASANLSYSELRSPTNGTVTEQHIFPGDLADPATSLFTVADLSSAVARAQVAEGDAGSVKVGQTCSFSLRDSSQTARFGHITVVNQAVDTARRTVEAWCEIPNSDTALKAGEFGSVSIAVGTADHAIVLPASAVQFDEGTQKATVFTVDGSHIAHQREVQAVALSDKRVRILSGLAPGELVITSGEYGLPDGTQVTVGGGAQ